METNSNINTFEEFMLENLPHGSGIDCKYEFTYTEKKCKISNSWHLMDDMGGYIGFIDFTVKIPIIYTVNEDICYSIDNILDDFKITFQTNSNGYYQINNYDLRTYLNDLYGQSFFDMVEIKEKILLELMK